MNNLISFEEFKETLDFIDDQAEKQNKLCNVLEELSPGCYCDAFIYSEYENRLMEMLFKLMNLNEDKINDLMYWFYDLEYGVKYDEYVKLNYIKGKYIEIYSSMESLYNYLINPKEE